MTFNDRFSNIFSVAILAAQCGSFLNGLILDNFGIFALRIAGTIYFLIAFGCLLFVPNMSVRIRIIFLVQIHIMKLTE